MVYRKSLNGSFWVDADRPTWAEGKMNGGSVRFSLELEGRSGQIQFTRVTIHFDNFVRLPRESVILPG